MRKTINRTTVIVVLAIFLCLSVGYALFSDTITIEGTATAQGNFDIEAECYTGIAPSGENYNYAVIYEEEHGYSNDKCEVVGDKVMFSTEFNYPGALRYYTVKLTNIGTIGAKFNISDLHNTTNYFCQDGINGVKNGAIDDDECSNQGSTSITDNLHTAHVFVKSDGTEIIYDNETSMSQIWSHIMLDDTTLKLEPNESIYFALFMTLNNDASSNLDPNGFLIKNTITRTFNFMQLD